MTSQEPVKERAGLWAFPGGEQQVQHPCRMTSSAWRAWERTQGRTGEQTVKRNRMACSPIRKGARSQVTKGLEAWRTLNFMQGQ